MAIHRKNRRLKTESEKRKRAWKQLREEIARLQTKVTRRRPWKYRLIKAYKYRDVWEKESKCTCDKEGRRTIMAVLPDSNARAVRISRTSVSYVQPPFSRLRGFQFYVLMFCRLVSQETDARPSGFLCLLLACGWRKRTIARLHPSSIPVVTCTDIYFLQLFFSI